MKKHNKKFSGVGHPKSILKSDALQYPESRLCANILSYAVQLVNSDLDGERGGTFYPQRRNS